MAELMLISLVGAVLCLDSHAVGQWMISRPIVTGALVGLLIGDVASGLLIGVLLELVWIGKLPIGISIPSDITLPTVTATVLMVHLKGAGVVYPEVAAILLSLPFGFLRSLLDRFNREMMTVYARRVESQLVRGREGALVQRPVAGPPAPRREGLSLAATACWSKTSKMSSAQDALY